MDTVYRCDFLVGDILLELKAQSSLGVVDEAQLLHYLRATDLQVGLLLNFGSVSLGVRRMGNRRASPKSSESLLGGPDAIRRAP